MKADIDKSERTKQKEYAEKLESQGFSYGLAVGVAFVESMRNTYYRHAGTALDELVDNSIEAGSKNIHIAFGYGPQSDKKPESIAVVDDGHGMDPAMLRLAPLWGGTHREGQRTGFGRFGFGLPSASVNQCRRFSIFSKTEDSALHSITVDLDEIQAGKYNDANGNIVAPKPQPANLPGWLNEYISENLPKKGFNNGTIILWEKLDRITWSTTAGLRKNLAEHLGLTFRNYIGKTRIVLDGLTLQPIDPLFATPDARYFDYDEDKATVLDPSIVRVKDKVTDDVHEIRVRYSRFPLGFFAIDKSKKTSQANRNPRAAINTKHRGIIISRMGRQIDVLQRTGWPELRPFSNNDDYWSVEIDFPAALDEEFSIANSKQGVIISDRIWDIMREAGVMNAITELHRSVEKDQKAKQPEADSAGRNERPSEISMKEADKFDQGRTAPGSLERENRAMEELKRQIQQKAKREKRSEKELETEHKEEARSRPYQVVFEDIPGAPFYRAQQIGGIFKLYVNRAHRFYTDLYASSASNIAIRSALETLLFVLGDCELDAEGNEDKQEFYRFERRIWSNELEKVLGRLAMFEFGIPDSEIEEVA